jgi:hypothetical protein
MTLRLNGQTSGYVELEAPGTAGSNTLVLPTGNGTSGQYLQTNGSGALSFADPLGSAAAVSGTNFQFNSGYGSVATAYGCRAWVNFNGTGTVAIRASGNVSSITDNGTGDYTVNFTTAMPDANYCICATRGQNGNTNPSYVMAVREVSSAPSTSSFTLTTNAATGGQVDSEGVYVAVFR